MRKIRFAPGEVSSRRVVSGLFFQGRNIMRVMLRASIPVEVGNAAIKDGSLPKKTQAILNELKPEAAYFSVMNTGRGRLFSTSTWRTSRRW
jgi:hypothetical protein